MKISRINLNADHGLRGKKKEGNFEWYLSR